jgi:endonuclease YncB( thermonuclease family)
MGPGYGLKWIATRASALACLLLGFNCIPALADSWVVDGRVVGVSDGDTITVLDDAKTRHKIRFAGIDAPEKGQAFGEQSKQSLSAPVFQKRVEAYCHKKDRYGPEVCTVFASLRDVGLEQIRAGMAWHYKEHQHEQTTQDRLMYRDEEESAKASRVGLWKGPKPVPPWTWRREKVAKP